MEAKLQELRQRLQEVNDLVMAAALLHWDQSTYMPPGGAEARGRQIATLWRLFHEKFTDPAIGRLLDTLQPYAESLPDEADDARLIRVTIRDYERQTRVPSDFVAQVMRHATESYQAWTEARPANDFKRMQPYLEKTLEYSRQYANYFPGYDHIADPLIDDVDYGMKAESVRAVFAQLRKAIVPLVQAITDKPPADDSFLRKHYPEKHQRALGEEIIRNFGYDFTRGRQDLTHHPFMTKFSLGDVRITTRVYEHDFAEGFFSTLHEAGHAMYEQGIRREFEGSPLAHGTSAGVHESQSRTWENIVGRSRGFVEHFYPLIQQTFPEQLKGVSADDFYRAINKVQRSLIRVDADEVTYNLHVMIRFDLELQLLEGSLAIRDLPEAWNARYKSDLGLSAPDDRDGVLQDVHWNAGRIGGMFQGYALGNIMSAQFYNAALKAHPSIPDDIRQGRFETLHGWQKDNIYQHGSKFTANELLDRVVGGPLDVQPLVDYLTAKFGDLYSL